MFSQCCLVHLRPLSTVLFQFKTGNGLDSVLVPGWGGGYGCYRSSAPLGKSCEKRSPLIDQRDKLEVPEVIFAEHITFSQL